MGKWKYVNIVVLVIILVFMYRYFLISYDAPLHLYITTTLGWFIMAFLGYYIFSYRIKKESKSPKEEIKVKKSTERPKVGLKRNKN
ncbi:MAG: hypothetical protein WD555_03610 [Fulvivirga sp.]